MKELALTKGKVAFVDDDVYEFLSRSERKFYFNEQKKGTGVGYAKNDTLGRLHIFVMQFHGIEIPDGMDVDHKNGSRLDCQFDNLQLLTRRENLLKKDHRQYANQVGYIGVIERTDHRYSRTRYRAYVNHEAQTHWNGTYDTPAEAARAHDELAIRLQGKFANLNFPTSETEPT
jgi:hypothetical protein